MKQRDLINFMNCCNEVFDIKSKIKGNIIKDFSKGSMALTFLIYEKEKKYFRKYAFGDEKVSLENQMKWMKENYNKINVAEINNFKSDEKIFYYDMPYVEGTLNLFEYVCKNGSEQGIQILNKLMIDLKQKFDLENKYIDKDENLNLYITEKIYKNLNFIKESGFIKETINSEKIIINGVEYRNIETLEKYIAYEKIYKVLKNDKCSDIHGDLTLENIICDSNHNYYLIDPNVINYHNAINLEYSKILQSLHGKYEFLQTAKVCKIKRNEFEMYINEDVIKYNKMYKKYKEMLYKEFNNDELKSIYYNEIVHWIRLLKHQILKNGEKALIYYLQFIIIFNEIVNEFGD